MRAEFRQHIYDTLQSPFVANLDQSSRSNVKYTRVLEELELWPVECTEGWTINDILARLEAFDGLQQDLLSLPARATHGVYIQDAKEEIRRYGIGLCSQCMKNGPTFRPANIAADHNCPIRHGERTRYWSIRAKDWKRAI